MTLSPSGRTRLIFKINVKMKHEKDLLSSGFKKKPLKRYQVSKPFLQEMFF